MESVKYDLSLRDILPCRLYICFAHVHTHQLERFEALLAKILKEGGKGVRTLSISNPNDASCVMIGN